MKVIATARGYDNTVLREVGEEFTMPEGSKGSWFIPKPAEAKAAKPKKDDDKNVSDLT